MPRRFHHSCLVRQLVSARCLFLITAIGFLTLVIWMQSMKKYDEIVQEAIENISHDLRYISVYRKPSKLSKDVKYILLWTPDNFSPFYFFGTGQKAFVDNKCPVTNCYVTSDRNLFDGDVTQFDAIAFNGRNMKYLRHSRLPRQRSMRQKYIFFNLESADNYPVCPVKYEGYFNWTATYKLSSDIPSPYIIVKNMKGEVVGPKVNMNWTKDYSDVDERVVSKLGNKTKAIAWFVSACKVRSNRNEFYHHFSRALEYFNLTIHVYGKCGTYKCPIDNKEDCNKMLEKDYFFYLSMENSFAEDYITEKVLTALQNNVVPILYGAANYSRFLPPASYIDARRQDVLTLAAKVARLISFPEEYSQFFRWKRHYTLQDPTSKENICAVCAALHNKTMMETETVYTNFREWWNPGYMERCSWLVDDDI